MDWANRTDSMLHSISTVTRTSDSYYLVYRIVRGICESGGDIERAQHVYIEGRNQLP